MRAGRRNCRNGRCRAPPARPAPLPARRAAGGTHPAIRRRTTRHARARPPPPTVRARRSRRRWRWCRQSPPSAATRDAAPAPAAWPAPARDRPCRCPRPRPCAAAPMRCARRCTVRPASRSRNRPAAQATRPPPNCWPRTPSLPVAPARWPAHPARAGGCARTGAASRTGSASHRPATPVRSRAVTGPAYCDGCAPAGGARTTARQPGWDRSCRASRCLPLPARPARIRCRSPRPEARRRSPPPAPGHWHSGDRARAHATPLRGPWGPAHRAAHRCRAWARRPDAPPAIAAGARRRSIAHRRPASRSRGDRSPRYPATGSNAMRLLPLK